MHSLAGVASGISAAAFIWYGAGCFLSKRMEAEFARYGVPRLRRWTGFLQILAGLGLIAGFVYRPFMLSAAGGLTVMMLVGVGIRIRIRDPWYAALPASLLMLLNAYIFWRGW
ncbi:MAG: DoxX family protein [Acidobacteriaceae bacterium]